MSGKRLAPDVRSGQILDAAIKLAKSKGFGALTRDGIADAAGVSTGLVSNYFGNMDAMKNEVMKVAVRDEILPVIAAGIVAGNRIAKRAPEALRKRAVHSLAA
jgi:AcrR family transcriptional regulator